MNLSMARFIPAVLVGVSLIISPIAQGQSDDDVLSALKNAMDSAAAEAELEANSTNKETESAQEDAPPAANTSVAPLLKRDFRVEEVKAIDWRAPLQIDEFRFELYDPSGRYNPEQDNCRVSSPVRLPMSVESLGFSPQNWRRDDGLDASAHKLGKLVEKHCPNVVKITLMVPGGSGVSSTSVEKRYDWHMLHHFKQMVEAQKIEKEAFRATPQFQPYPTNPLSDRKIYAAREVGVDGAMTLYEAFLTEKDYKKNKLSHVIVHDIDYETPLFGVVLDSNGSFDTYSEDFVSRLNNMLEQSGNVFAFGTGTMRFLHYVRGFHLKDKPVFGEEPVSEAPFVATQFDSNEPYSQLATITLVNTFRDRSFAPSFVVCEQSPVNVKCSSGLKADYYRLVLEPMLRGDAPITVAQYSQALELMLEERK